jgi:hypothetical protein
MKRIAVLGSTGSIGTQTLDVYLLNDHRIFPLESLSCGEDISVLRDIGTAGEDDVGGRFAYTGRGVHIAAMHTHRLLFDHLATEDMLTDDAVGRGEVEDDLCSLNSQLRRRRQR